MQLEDVTCPRNAIGGRCFLGYFPDDGTPNPEPVYLNHYRAHRSLQDNVFAMTRPMWGKARAEWAMWLADEVIERFPEAEDVRQRRGWSAALLWAVAIATDMDETVELWEQVQDEICCLTGISRSTAQRRWRMLKSASLERPKNDPYDWRGEPAR